MTNGVKETIHYKEHADGRVSFTHIRIDPATKQDYVLQGYYREGKTIKEITKELFYGKHQHLKLKQARAERQN